MIDIIYKTVIPSHLKKLLIKQNIKNLMFQVIFIFSVWVLIKLFIIHFCCWGKQIFEKILPGRVISFSLGRDGKNSRASFACGKAWVKMPQINACSRIWKFSPHFVNIKVWKETQQTFWREIKPYRVYKDTEGRILQTNLEGQRW